MKKWLPYIVAAVLGVGVAALMFMPETSTGSKTTEVEPTAKVSRTIDDKGMTMKRVQDGQDPSLPPAAVAAAADGSPAPGTLRPLSPGEIAHQERRERPFNQHYMAVAPYWNKIAPMIGPTNMAFAKECSQMELYLRDQSKLVSDELDVNGTIEKEKQLEKKIRSLGIQNDELNSILDYIHLSADTVIQGGDPTSIARPGKG